MAASVAAQAAIFPDQIGLYTKSAPKTIGIPDQALYDEYGLEATESADYVAVDAEGKANKSSKRFSAVAWRMHDSTGALALFQFRRPSAAARASFADLAVRTSDGIIYAFGNYVFQFTGGQPEQNDLPTFYNQLPRLERSPLPALISYMPADGLIPNSERYVVGPVSLSRFESRIPPSTAAFRMGAEGETGQFQTPKGPMTLALFSYPTPSIARDQAIEFQKVPAALVKRTGPMVAIIVAPPDADAAERLLSKVNYQASVTLNEAPPQDVVKGAGKMLLSIVALAGIILCLCVIGGIGFGGFRVLARKIQKHDPAAMIVLDLDRH